MKTIAETACRLLEQGATFVLATIVSHTGSTPRTAGSKMIVTADGRGIGTIGGGLLEARAMARAAEPIPSGKSALMPFDLSDETVAALDMICGGRAEVLLDCVAPSEANREVFKEWRRILADLRPGCFLTAVRTAGGDVADVAHAILGEADDLRGAFPLSAVARQRVLESFEGCFDGPALNGEDFVVILTRGHLHDQTVLAGALATGAGYIGMIGSRRKRNTVYGNLRHAGVPQDALDRVHAPIGLAIGAETPEEIAVSIVAELIAARAGGPP
jgi:xanthine dehydrogenase accessory factor